MANAFAGSTRNVQRWGSILTGAGLSLVLSFLAAALSAALQSSAAVPVFGALAFLLAGAITIRIWPLAEPIAPALGAGAMMLLFGILQVTIGREQFPVEAPPLQLALAVILSVVISVVLCWLGAKLMKMRATRRTARV